MEKKTKKIVIISSSVLLVSIITLGLCTGIYFWLSGEKRVKDYSTSSYLNLWTEEYYKKENIELSKFNNSISSSDSSFGELPSQVDDYTIDFNFKGKANAEISYIENMTNTKSDEKFGFVGLDIELNDFSEDINYISTTRGVDSITSQKIEAEQLSFEIGYIFQYDNYSYLNSRIDTDSNSESWWHQTTKIRIENIYGENISASNDITKEVSGVEKKYTGSSEGVNVDRFTKVFIVGSSGETEKTYQKKVADLYLRVKTGINIDWNYNYYSNGELIEESKFFQYSWLDSDGYYANKFSDKFFGVKQNSELNHQGTFDYYYEENVPATDFKYPITFKSSLNNIEEANNFNKLRSVNTSNPINSNVVPLELVANQYIKVDAGDMSGDRDPFAKVDIGFDSDYVTRDYTSRTNKYGQLAFVKADKVIPQNDELEPVTNDGRYFSSEANVEGVGNPYDKGHVIADSLGGVSNGYNITPQHKDVNQMGGDQFALETEMRNADGVKNFRATFIYADSTTQTPSSYYISYIVDGKYKEYVFDNILV